MSAGVMSPHGTSSWKAQRVAQWLRHGVVTAVLVASSLLPTASLVFTATTAHAQQDYVYPAANWEPVSSPESAGFSSAGLEQVRAQLATMDTDAMMVIVGGRVLFEYGNTATVSYLASARKSVLSMLYGVHAGNGTIKLDKTLEQLGIDDHGGLTHAERQATTRHLLMARSGVYHAASNSGDDLAYAPPRGSQAPGSYFLYSNWDFNAAGAIFESAGKHESTDAAHRN